MKNLLTIISLFVVLTGHAQSTQLTYNTVITDHLNADGGFRFKTVHKAKGSVSLSDKLLFINEGKPSQQVYAIIKGSDVYDIEDENYRSRSIKLAMLGTGGKSVRLINCVIITSPKGAITDIIIKADKFSRLDYIFN